MVLEIVFLFTAQIFFSISQLCLKRQIKFQYTRFLITSTTKLVSEKHLAFIGFCFLFAVFCFLEILTIKFLWNWSLESQFGWNTINVHISNRSHQKPWPTSSPLVWCSTGRIKGTNNNRWELYTIIYDFCGYALLLFICFAFFQFIHLLARGRYWSSGNKMQNDVNEIIKKQNEAHEFNKRRKLSNICC